MFNGFIGSMLALYLPPFETSGDDSDELLTLTLHALKPYVIAMESYPPDVVAKAWQTVVEEHRGRGWPGVSDLVKACQSVAGRKSQAAQNDERRTRSAIAAHQDRISREFWGFFQAQDLWHQAVAEGWALSLMQWVGPIVIYQARILVFANGGELKISDSRQIRQRYCLECLEREGRIAVDVPSDLVEQWKRAAA